MKVTFRTKLFLPLILSWICLLTVMGFNVMHERSLRLDERKIQLSSAGGMAFSIAKEYGELAASGALPAAEAKTQALARIKALRYGENGYFTVIDSSVVLMHPIKPELIGTAVADFKDPLGTQVFVDALNAVRESGSGFTNFLWTKPGEQKPEPKLSYNVSFKPWGWTFMTGLHTDDVHNAFIANLVGAAILLGVIGIALTAVVLFIVRNIERSIGGEPEQAVEFARRIAAATWKQRSTSRPATRPV